MHSLFRMDHRGHFHALFHFTRGHAWSEDGLNWRWGGGKKAFKKRAGWEQPAAGKQQGQGGKGYSQGRGAGSRSPMK